MNKNRQELYEMQAEIVKSLSHPIRLAIIDFLGSDEKCVCEIAEFVGGERSNTSKHLAIMSSAGVLEQRKDGLKVFYKVRTPCVGKFLNCVGTMLKEQIKQNSKVIELMKG